MTDQDTAELVRRAVAGDELAWRQLIDGLGSAYRLGEAEAADAVATARLKLVENIGSLRDDSAVQGWLMTTLRRKCLARASARSRERLLADFAGVAESVDVIDAGSSASFETPWPTRRRGASLQTPGEFDYGATPPDHAGCRVPDSARHYWQAGYVRNGPAPDSCPYLRARPKRPQTQQGGN